MSLGARRTLVAVLLSVVVVAVIGLIFLQVLNQAGAHRVGWLVTADVQAGTPFSDANVKQVRIPSSGDAFLALDQSPINKKAATNLRAQTLLRQDDVFGDETALVPMNLRSAPPLHRGDRIDVFATGNDGKTVLVGRGLVVVGAGNPAVLAVQASTEQAWITLQANNVPLFATQSPGLTVGTQGGSSVQEALTQLASSTGSAPPNPGPPPSPSPAPSSPAPTQRPTPR
jgi:hypothetical protein